jgi:hypothetical protein
MQLLESQTLLNDAKSNKLEVTIKKPLPATDRKDLQASRDATGKLDELKASTQRLLDKNGQLPIGAIRTMQLALANAAGIDTGTTNSAQLGGRLGLAGIVGADGQVTSTVGGKVIDIKAYENAFRAIDKTKLSDDEKAFINDYEQAVQIIGKDLEGGKLTDADLQNYKKILFVTESPTAFINSLNQIGNRVANKYTNTRNVLSDSFNITNWYPEYVWEPISYEGTITESPLSDAARLRIPGRGVDRTAAAGRLLDQAMQTAPDASDAPGNQ